MLTKFWEKLGEGLAGEWNVRMITPAFAFWGGALVAYAWKYGWNQIDQFLQTTSVVTGAALLIAGVFLLAVSAGMVNWLTLPVLRWVEGYWSAWLWRLRRWFTDRLDQKVAKKETECGELADKLEKNSLDSQGYERYVRLEAELDNCPVDMNARMPTRMGNSLRATEEYPNRCYGLEISTTWPRLWLSLPENTQQALNETRQALNWDIQLVIWGVMFIIWVIWAWWAPLVGLLVAVSAYLRLQTSANVYGQLLRSAYDLHRFMLYEGLRWPLPTGPETEKQMGEVLTIYLKRSIAAEKLLPNNEKLTFQHPTKN